MQKREAMPGLANFERMIESLVERSMIAPLRGKLQPIEIAKRLERSLRDEALLSVDAQIAPNHFVVRLNLDDFAALAPARILIEGELAHYVAQSGSAQGYVFVAPPTVELVASDAVSRRTLAVVGEIRQPGSRAGAAIGRASEPAVTQIPVGPVRASDTESGAPVDAAWTLDFGGWSAPLPRRPITIGRALDCDVVVPSPRVSRHHAELSPAPGGLCLRDLGSTNGTTVDGQAVADPVVVRPGARVAFGGVEAMLRAATSARPS